MVNLRRSLRFRAEQMIMALRDRAPGPSLECEELALQARDLAVKAGDRVLEAEALLQLGKTFVPSANPRKIWLLLHHARSIFEMNDMAGKALSCRLGLAQLLFDMGEEANAMAAAQHVLEQPHLSAQDRGFAHILIALCHSHIGELDTALHRLSNVAMPLAKICTGTRLLAQVKWAQGLTYIRLHMYKRSVELFRGWPDMPEITADLPDTADIYALFDQAQSLIPNGVHWPYLDIGKLLACGLMEPSRDAADALRLIASQHSKIDPPLAARALFCQGLVLRRLKMPMEALDAFSRSLDIAGPLESWSITRDATLNISRIHEELGNFEEALSSYKRYSDLRLRGLLNSANLDSAYFGPFEGAGAGGRQHQLRVLEPAFVKRATKFILENVEKKMTVEDVVQCSGVSRRTLEVAFKEAKSVTVARFIRSHKIQRAAVSLAQTDFSVGEVSKRFGFMSPEVFSRDFRAIFGCSPTRWRAIQR